MPKSSKLRIKQVSAKNLFHCAYINRAIFGDQIISSENLSKFLRTPGNGGYVAYINYTPVGAAAYSFNEKTKQCELLFIGVSPPWRRQGIGSALITRIAEGYPVSGNFDTDNEHMRDLIISCGGNIRPTGIIGGKYREYFCVPLITGMTP